MPKDLAEILRQHPRRIDSTLVFPSPSAAMFNPSTLRDSFHSHRKRAGLRRIKFHDLRHTYASHLVMRGVPLVAVQRYLGHADIKTTMRYAHLAPEVLDSYVDVLNCTTTEPQNSGHKTATNAVGGPP